jgi:tRNA pseudouridine55 synthase
MNEKPTGFILINKPKDWTSHDVVGYLRKVTHIKKIGHAGTLDPFATGLLIVGIGREATKRLDEFKTMKKTYVATLKLGATSDTYDGTGKTTYHTTHNTKQGDNGAMEQCNNSPTQEQITATLKSFVGRQNQIPPMYSAKKINGKKLYELARKGIEIERKPNEIEIYNIELLKNMHSPLQGEGQGEVVILVSCSSGTYIRSLAHDIGQKLGCGAYCEELERTSIGKYTLENAQELSELTGSNFQSKLFV